MGIIAKQSIQGTIVTYLGVAVGFVTTFFVLTRFLSAEEIGFYIELEEGVTGVMYMSSGETAEEVAVFTAPDEDTALSVKEALEDFLEEQSDAFKNYEPETVERIDDAVLEQRGVYVIMCVSDESQKAVDIIKEAFGE